MSKIKKELMNKKQYYYQNFDKIKERKAQYAQTNKDFLAEKKQRMV